MAAHLGDGQIVDGPTLTAAVDADLASLAGSYTATDEDDQARSPTPVADTLLNRWTKKGWVHRTPDPDRPVERYQLTSGASHAVRQIRSLRRQTSIATESALAMVMAEMRQIATEANPDPAARKAAINDQIAMLVAQRDALDRGEMPEANSQDLVDRVTALTQLTDRIPADIARYGEQMHDNTAALLRQSLSDDPTEFAESLQRMFDGHDVIADSPEGQAFRAFATLIATPSQRSQLESDIHEILSRMDGLPAHLTESLSGFLDAMWRRVEDVERTRAVAFRRMSKFVQGGDAQHYRSMRLRVSEAQASAAKAFHVVHGGTGLGFAVPVNGIDANSVGRIRLDPGTATAPDPVVDSSSEFNIRPEDVVSKEGINWSALRHAVHAAMEAHGNLATLPEVLEQLPEPRTGEIVGLWWLATEHGEVDQTSSTTVIAHTSHGRRPITVPYLVFGNPIPDDVTPASDRSPLSATLPEGVNHA